MSQKRKLGLEIFPAFWMGCLRNGFKGANDIGLNTAIVEDLLPPSQSRLFEYLKSLELHFLNCQSLH